MFTGYKAPDLRTKKKKLINCKICEKDCRHAEDCFHRVEDCAQRAGDRYDVSGTVNHCIDIIWFKAHADYMKRCR